jgi:hypothetical protein
MNPDPHSDAFKFLYESTFLDEKKIEQMTLQQIDSLLEDMGQDVSKLNERIAAKKLKWAGRFVLLAARQRRLAEANKPEQEIVVPATKEAILLHFKDFFGNEMPIAAQKCKGMEYEELAQLYRDLMSDKK